MKRYSLDLEPTYRYEAKSSFNLVKTLREAQDRTNRPGNPFPEALADDLDGSGLLTRVNQWASWILPSENVNLEEMLLGDTMIDPIGRKLQSPRDDTPLIQEEIDITRDNLLEFFRSIGQIPTERALQEFKMAEPSKAIVSGPEHAVTRWQMRLANRELPDLDGMSIREWHSSLPIDPLAPKPPTVSQIDGSPLLLGNGPIGGHRSAGKHLWKSSWKISANSDVLDQYLGVTRGKVMNALDLHGSEINSNGVDDVLRDEEVAAFLIGMLEMKVKAVVACGYVNAHDESNIKTLIDLPPYFNQAKSPRGKADSHGNLHPSYRKGAPRDFFNYFGCCDGDDWIRWRTIEPTASGLRRKQVNIAGLTVTSTCLTKDTQGRPIDSSYKVPTNPKPAFSACFMHLHVLHAPRCLLCTPLQYMLSAPPCFFRQ
mmetsp:Transcript_27420/g.77452  ORF Transcript_27420/g.77452 Transcript_27420/m.77452 type:complete len:427 (+) Transcript_27420:663-1943(+)